MLLCGVCVCVLCDYLGVFCVSGVGVCVCVCGLCVAVWRATMCVFCVWCVCLCSFLCGLLWFLCDCVSIFVRV